MNRPLVLVLAFLLGLPAVAQDVFVPPVPKGIARDGKVRTPERPIPFPAANRRWIRVRSQRFDVISSAKERRTLEIVQQLETLAATLSQTNPHLQENATPATVFVFAKRRESQPYFDLLLGGSRRRATGAYVRHDGGGSMFIDAAQRQFAKTAMHELVHDLLRQRGTIPPLWIEEGLAEYFANASIRRDRLIAGHDVPEHVSLIARTRSRSVRDVLDVRAESPEATSPHFYARSWAAVDWLMELDDDAFWRFLATLERGTPLSEALREHYGKTLDDLDRAVGNPQRNSRTVSLERRSAGGPAPPANTIDRATLLYELGRFLSHVAGAEKDSERHYRAALEANPDHARTLAALGEFERAVAAGPDDAEVHLAYAESLLDTATGPFAGVFEAKEGDARRFRKARGLADHALRLALASGNAPDEGRAHGLIGTSYLIETDVSPGIAHLERTRQLLPARSDFALNLYAMYLRSGRRGDADALFAAVFESSRERQVIFAARNVLLREETERANALARSGELDAAAAVVRELAAATADSNGRRDLEQQAARLEATAAVNRHINMYNDAVTNANASRNREALKILDEILRVASDAAVISDAERLKRDLEKRLRRR